MGIVLSPTLNPLRKSRPLYEPSYSNLNLLPQEMDLLAPSVGNP